MKLVLQRVSEASVSIGSTQSGAIDTGLVVFLCVEIGDDSKIADHYANKVAELRIFPDDQGKMNRSVKEAGGSVLLISQFTLAADAEKGRRPSFIHAARPDQAEPLYNHFAEKLRSHGIPVSTGVFQAFMKVSLVNDGPVTIILGGRSSTEGEAAS
ncbi:MAG TPA: D-aminoacyl-tRNA deacylase [Acidobacteriota bacterium]|nr:D-aminoacyl-tRNA deacylase [Acidobacteriota bacterium]